MGDQEHARDRAGALVLELEEARARDELAAAQAAEERDPPLRERQAGGFSERDDLAGEVDE
ncbi:MAG: hypothetical protein ACRDL0_16810, partial [Thermoleophilaceae bacterium]